MATLTLFQLALTYWPPFWLTLTEWPPFLTTFFSKFSIFLQNFCQKYAQICILPRKIVNICLIITIWPLFLISHWMGPLFWKKNLSPQRHSFKLLSEQPRHFKSQAPPLTSYWGAFDLTTDGFCDGSIAISFMCTCVKFVLRRSSQCYNTQRAWQLPWWGHNIWCLTVVGAVRRANRKLRIIPQKTSRSYHNQFPISFFFCSVHWGYLVQHQSFNGQLHPNSKLSIFVCYLKIIDTFMKK